MVDQSPPRINPGMTIDHHLRVRGIQKEDLPIAPVVVVSWSSYVIRALAKSIRGRQSRHWFYGSRQLFYTGRVDGRMVSLLQAPVGAPGTVMIMEELIACGVHTFLGLGWAGSLQPYAPVGAMLIPTDCIREEGTSFHYLDPGAEMGPDPVVKAVIEAALAAEGLTPHCGPHWTIDAPYRELVAKISTYAAQGVQGVDMETSAMYGLGVFRQVRVANLLVVSDELWHEWRPAFGTDELGAANLKAMQTVLRCLKDERLFSC